MATPKNAAKKPARKSTAKKKTKKGSSERGLSADERTAMKEYLREKRAAGKGQSSADAESEVLAKIAAMSAPDRALAERVHAVVKAAAPSLEPKTWYGMPAYAKDGKVVCHFQNAGKFKMKYSTFGFSDKAKLDDGAMWPVAFALTEMTPAVESKITALVKKAVR